MFANISRKAFSVLMSLVMVVGLCPAASFAVEPDATLTIAPETKQAVADEGDAQGADEGAGGNAAAGAPLPLDAQSDENIAEGTSRTCKWVIDADGKLTISPSEGDEGELGDWASYDGVPWYSQRSQITSVVFEGTIQAATCRYMFYDCSSLSSLDLSSLDTSQVTSMYQMFYGCSSLSSLDLSSLDTSKVTSMGYMFSGCSSLSSLNLSSFDTSGVTASGMSNMFRGCSLLSSVTLGDAFGFKGSDSHLPSPPTTGRWVDADGPSTALTPAVLATYHNQAGSRKTYREATVNEAPSATLYPDGALVFQASGPADLSRGEPIKRWAGFDTKAYTSASQVPWYDRHDSITSVEVGEGVAPLSTAYWFSGCSRLASADLSGLDTSQATDMRYMFFGCSSLSSLDLSPLDTSKVTRMQYMFFGCSSLSSLDLSSFDTSQVTDMTYMFSGCSSLSSVTLGEAFEFKESDSHLPSPPTTGRWVDDGNPSTALTPAELAEFHGQAGAAATYRWATVAEAPNATLYPDGALVFQASGPADLSRGEPIERWAGFDTKAYPFASQVPWYGSRDSITSVEVGEGVAPLSTAYWFSGCSGLASADLSGLDTSKVTDMRSMFSGCSSLGTVYVDESWTLPAEADCTDMFSGCTSLVGGNGTRYDAAHAGGEYARADAPGAPGYFTLKAAPAAADLSDAEVAAIPDQAYTGGRAEPAPRVTLGGTELKRGTDYEVSYKNNVDAGTATVTVTGKGNYTGTKTVSFKISPAQISGAAIDKVADQKYDGKAKTPAPAVKLAGRTLKAGTDYTLSYKNNTAAGTATVTVTGKGNYTGSKSVSFKISRASLSGAAVGKVADQKYDGKAKTPAPAVKMGGRTLKAGTDYTLSYKNNTAAGTATVTVTGKGNYAGSASATFKIVRSAAAWKRLAGEDRYGTMAAIVAEGFTSSQWAVIASGGNFPDALAASALAGTKGCPVILTTTESLSPQASARLKALGVKKVFVMGGNAAISRAAESSVRSMGISVVRVAGATRTDTSVEALKQVRRAGSASDTVIVASGQNFPDALSIGPWSYSARSPIVLTQADGTLTAAEVSAIRADGKFKKVVIVGGTAAVSDKVRSQLGSSFSFARLAGPDRYSTSREIAKWEVARGMSYLSPSLATGRTFPDALAGAALAGKRGSVLLLADSTSDVTMALLKEQGKTVVSGYFLGGVNAVKKDVASRAQTVTK